MKRPFFIGSIPIVLFCELIMSGCLSTGDLQGVAGSMAGAASGWIPGSGGSALTAASVEDEAALTPAERRMRQQSRAFQKTVWEGALIGASAGTLYGVIRGERAQDVARDALIGGAAGGLAGVYVAHLQQKYATKEDQLEAMTADVQKSNQETQAFIASVREVINEDQRRLAAVEQQVRKGQATQAQLQATRRQIAANGQVVAQASKGAREKASMFAGAERQYRKDHPGTDTARLQRELDGFNKNIKTLDGLAQSVSVA
jgi:hypothetical protein